MKNIIKIAVVAVFTTIAGYGVYAYQRSETMSDLVLANVEALANNEGDDKIYDCYKTISSGNVEAQTTDVRYCGSCEIQPANYYSGGGVCSNR